MHPSRKPITLAHGRARAALELMSKSALADLVVDLLRQQRQDRFLDGDDLLNVLDEEFAVLATERGDRRPLDQMRRAEAHMAPRRRAS